MVRSGHKAKQKKRKQIARKQKRAPPRSDKRFMKRGRDIIRIKTGEKKHVGAGSITPGGKDSRKAVEGLQIPKEKVKVRKERQKDLSRQDERKRTMIYPPNATLKEEAKERELRREPVFERRSDSAREMERRIDSHSRERKEYLKRKMETEKRETKTKIEVSVEELKKRDPEFWNYVMDGHRSGSPESFFETPFMVLIREKNNISSDRATAILHSLIKTELKKESGSGIQEKKWTSKDIKNIDPYKWKEIKKARKKGDPELGKEMNLRLQLAKELGGDHEKAKEIFNKILSEKEEHWRDKKKFKDKLDNLFEEL